jgi:glycosyltransferase involved in cell wall biosynthesis
VTRETAREVLGILNDATVLLYLGQIRGYKNVPVLIQMFRRLDAPRLFLLVAGQPTDATLERAVRDAGAGDSRVRLSLSFLPDEALQLYLNAADLLVLPYHEILNSGTAILGLSFDRPVLVPAKGALKELQDLVGPAWVRTFEGALSGEALSEALAWARTVGRAPRAPLDALCWNTVSRATIAAYESILGERSGAAE